MNKLLLSVFVLLMSTTLQAQTWDYGFRQNYVRIGIGIPPLPLAFETEVYDSALPGYGEKIYSLEKTTTASFNVGYGYRVAKRFSVEIMASYFGSREPIYHIYTDQKLGTDTDNYLSIMPIVRWHWFNSEFVSLYSAAGFGFASYWGNERTGSSFRRDQELGASIQLTYIGISVGRRLFGFTELGASTSGIIQGGIGYKF